MLRHRPPHRRQATATRPCRWPIEARSAYKKPDTGKRAQEETRAHAEQPRVGLSEEAQPARAPPPAGVPRTSAAGVEVGQTVTVSIFANGDYVDVTGTTKGKGFQGGVKRHGFAGGPKTHGQSDRHRAPGSIGSGTTPGRVFKGTRMAGHMGHVRHTILNLQVVGVDEANNLLLIKGAIPGADEGLVTVRKAVKKQPPKHTRVSQGAINREGLHQDPLTTLRHAARGPGR